MKLFIIFMMCFMLTIGLAFVAPAYSQESLASLTEQLQKKPDDNALREKIIKFAVKVNPAPAIPEDARRSFVRGNTAIKEATSADDYANAIKLYNEALKIAPWWADAYFNLSKAQELHQDFNDSIQSLKYFLLSSPPQADARIAQDQIYVLEEKRDKKATVDKAKAEADKTKADAEKAIQAKRDVITKIKNIVNNRAYDQKIASFSANRSDIYGGVSWNELFGGGTYYLFGGLGCRYSWKFFDDYVELSSSERGCFKMIGESWGSEITDMHWFNNWGKGADREKSKFANDDSVTRTWGHFEIERGYLYINSGAMPLKDSEIDRNRRYYIELYKPF